MRYLTKEWYNLCQSTGIHFGVRVHKGAVQKDEALFLRLYKRKEKKYIKEQRELYDTDPRFMLKLEGSFFVPAYKFITNDEIHDEDTMEYHMTNEEKRHINTLIEEYDAREPFNLEKCKEEFRRWQIYSLSNIADKLPNNLYVQIADPRVFALGYCTKEILHQLKKFSNENKKRALEISNEYAKVSMEQDIPEKLRNTFGFHDCEVVDVTFGHEIIIYLDSVDESYQFNKVIFQNAKIILQENNFVGSTWLYEELYHTRNGYEVHMLFENGGVHEWTIHCKGMIIEQQ